jgi:glycosyltransferase involved in cell wall biosynthesis
MIRNQLYYQLKPLIPASVRMHVRRRFAARVRQRVSDVWPIMPGSERPPEGWPGWPEGKQFAFVLTHDVESSIGLERVRALAEVEMRLGFRSSFNFIPEGEYRVATELRRWLTNNGFEVGVHDLHHDGRLYRNRRQFSEKAGRINHYLKEWDASGFRSGFMLNRLSWLHELEVMYDASTFDTDPFEPQPEGRHTIFPFWVATPPSAPSSSSNGSTASPGFVELPYTLPQDSTLFLLLREKNEQIWTQKLDWIAGHGGMVLLDTHPDYVAFEGTTQRTNGYPVEFYERFLTYVASRHAGAYWHALPREVAGYIGRERARLHPHRSTPAVAQPAPQQRLRGRRGAVLLFSHYPADPRPRRAAEALVAEGAQVDVICLRRDEPKRENFGSINVLRLPVKRNRAGRISYVGQYSAFLLSCFAHLAVRSLRSRYDFVHVHNMPDVLVFSALVPKLLGARIVLDLHDPMPELMQTIFKLPEESSDVRMLKRLEKLSIRFADLVLTVNLACKKIYASRSCPAEKIIVVLNSPDDTIFQPNGAAATGRNETTPERPFDVLYHGSLVHRNGFDLAVDALERVGERIPSVRLTVCGEPTPYFEKVMESARARGLEPKIRYLGVRDLDQIVEAINNCDLGVIPNHRNIFTELNTPTRIFEYLALGKPVVAPKASGIQDYFGERDLLFFELGDSEDLARSIQFAHDHPEETRETVRRGQEVYRRHTWSREKERLVAAISDLW